MLQWVLRTLTRKGIRAGMVNRNTIVYFEDGRKMTIGGEMIRGGIVIHRSTILSWDDSNGELITESERERINGNLMEYLKSQGEEVFVE